VANKLGVFECRGRELDLAGTVLKEQAETSIRCGRLANLAAEFALIGRANRAMPKRNLEVSERRTTSTALSDGNPKLDDRLFA